MQNSIPKVVGVHSSLRNCRFLDVSNPMPCIVQPPVPEIFYQEPLLLHQLCCNIMLWHPPGLNFLGCVDERAWEHGRIQVIEMSTKKYSATN